MKYPVVFRLVFGFVALVCAGSVAAVQCRMPNGKTIELRTATQCPADAAEVDDAGRVLRPPRQTVAPAIKRPAPVADAAATPVAPPPAPSPTTFDVATAFCDLVRNTSSASECKVRSNVFSQSTIDVTTNIALRLAWPDCVKTAEQIRAMALAQFRANRWQLRYFSPFSGDRPIATCQI